MNYRELNKSDQISWPFNMRHKTKSSWNSGKSQKGKFCWLRKQKVWKEVSGRLCKLSLYWPPFDSCLVFEPSNGIMWITSKSLWISVILRYLLTFSLKSTKIKFCCQFCSIPVRKTLWFMPILCHNNIAISRKYQWHLISQNHLQF